MVSERKLPLLTRSTLWYILLFLLITLPAALLAILLPMLHGCPGNP